jgi:polyphosphate glucokinase
MLAVGVMSAKAITSGQKRLALLSVSDLKIGVDVGGSGIKAAVVDIHEGELVTDRIRVETPEPATPEAVTGVVVDVVRQLGSDASIGVGFPSVIQHGVALTANNIDQSWIGVHVQQNLSAALGRDVRVVNDADAAGVAEVRFGAAKDIGGVVIVLTFGTGVGSALIVDGQLVPNLELGQMEFDGVIPGERMVSAKARKTRGLEWSEWAGHVDRYLAIVESVFTPDLMILGGGAAKFWDEFADRIAGGRSIVPAVLSNDAGVVGAALIAN